MGHTDVMRYAGGVLDWALSGYYREVPTKAGADLFLDNGALAVDIRDQTAYDAGHLPGAIHAPAGDILAPGGVTAFLARSEVTATTTMVFYGDGPSADLHAVAAALEGSPEPKLLFAYPGGWTDYSAP